MTESVEDFFRSHGEEFGPTTSGGTESNAGVEKPEPGSLNAPVLSSGEFVRGFVPPDYVVDGIIQRGRVYSNTGQTGSGKTAVMLRLLASVALGYSIGGLEVEPGPCLMLVGENPDDVRARWIALSEQMGFLPDEIDVHFKPGIFPISALMPLLQQIAHELGGLSLIGVDTGAAFFDGDNENDNKQMGDYARRLRALTDLPGRPCALVNTHPVKNAGPDNLVPRGGGAFLNEMDGNLCCQLTGDTVNMSWQGKFRGPDFQPVSFQLLTVTSPKLVDSKGRRLPTVYATPLTEHESAAREDAASRDQVKVLVAMLGNDGASIAGLAEALNWRSRAGEPQKSKVQRILVALGKQKLATKELGNWALTARGVTAAKRHAPGGNS